MRRVVVFSAFALTAGVLQGLAGAIPTAAAVEGVSVVLDGHGNGHGIGLSQWGAYGYAVDQGWSQDQILDHYYGGTVAGAVALDTPITVRLQNLDGAQTAVSVETGELVVDGLGGGPWRSVLVRETSPAVYSVWARADLLRCPGANAADDPAAAGWTLLTNTAPSAVSVHTLADSTNISDPKLLAAVCEPSGTLRWYRGTIRAVNDSAGGNHTVSALPIEQYLRTVIAMEMSPGWADDGGGRGAQALQAQAVAARSYALASTGYGYANVCDMSCQAYYGVAFRPAGGLQRQVDASATDAAVLATAGVVRRIGSSSGVIALTMYSASNGGYTAPNNSVLTPFPAVPDDGDGTAANPNHNWTVTLTGSAISAKYPAIGSFTGLTVLARNGFGEWGGRVLSMSISGAVSSVTVTGSAFRSAMGLRDTWFNVRGGAPIADPCQGRVAPLVLSAAAPAAAARMTPLAPERLIDTRIGTGTSMLPLVGGCTLVVDPGLDPSVTAVAVNLTTVNTSGNGYVTAYPCGVARPVVSAVQTVAGRAVAGMTIVPLAADGTLCVYTHTTTDLVIDLFGTYAPGVGSNFEPVVPTRLFDSRVAVSRRVLRVKVAGTSKVPASATSAALTVHALGATAGGYVTVYPCSATVPLVSSVNAAAGVAVTNHVQVQLSASGEVCVYTNTPMRVILDVSGWFGPTATAQFYAVTPFRAVDSRINLGVRGRFVPGVNRAVTLAGTNGLPAAGLLRAVVAEVTSVGATRAGWVKVHPCMSPVPAVSVVRYIANVNAAATVAGGDDANGRWCVVTSSAVHVLVDISGYFA